MACQSPRIAGAGSLKSGYELVTDRKTSAPGRSPPGDVWWGFSDRGKQNFPWSFYMLGQSLNHFFRSENPDPADAGHYPHSDPFSTLRNSEIQFGINFESPAVFCPENKGPELFSMGVFFEITNRHDASSEYRSRHLLE
jgi:hypothetical protein